MKPSFFLNVKRRGLVVSHRRFEITCRPRLEWPSLTLEDGTNWSFINVGDYQSTLCNIPEERRSHLHRDGRVKSVRMGTEFVKQDWGPDGCMGPP